MTSLAIAILIQYQILTYEPIHIQAEQHKVRYVHKPDIAKMERKMEEWGIDIDTVIDIVEAALKELEQ